MLPGKYRLPLQPGIRLVGVPQHSPTLTLITKPNNLLFPRFAVIIPKSSIKLSSKRHRLTRQLHGLFLRNVSSFIPLDILLIIKSDSPEQILIDFGHLIKSVKSKI